MHPHDGTRVSNCNTGFNVVAKDFPNTVVASVVQSNELFVLLCSALPRYIAAIHQEHGTYGRVFLFFLVRQFIQWETKLTDSQHFGIYAE